MSEVKVNRRHLYRHWIWKSVWNQC